MQCQFKKQNKERCKAHILREGVFCFSHSERSKKSHKEAVKRGVERQRRVRSVTTHANAYAEVQSYCAFGAASVRSVVGNRSKTVKLCFGAR